MRVDLTVASVLAEAGSTSAVERLSGGVSAGQQSVPEDTASLSSSGLSVPPLTAQALGTTEARAAKVEALRQEITNATYAIDPDMIADALIGSGTF